MFNFYRQFGTILVIFARKFFKKLKIRIFRTMRKIIAITVIMLSVAASYAQKNITAKADKAFEAGKYFDAIDEYKYAFAKAKDKDRKNQITFMVAE